MAVISPLAAYLQRLGSGPRSPLPPTGYYSNMMMARLQPTQDSAAAANGLTPGVTPTGMPVGAAGGYYGGGPYGFQMPQRPAPVFSPFQQQPMSGAGNAGSRMRIGIRNRSLPNQYGSPVATARQVY